MPNLIESEVGRDSGESGSKMMARERIRAVVKTIDRITFWHYLGNRQRRTQEDSVRELE